VALQRPEDDELERPRCALTARRWRQGAVVARHDARGDLEQVHHEELVLVPGHRR
jgi:hypothetical protein